MKVREYFCNEVQISLLDVSYKSVGEKVSSASVQVADSIDSIDYDGDTLILKVTRRVYFEPEDLFNLQVTHLLEYHTVDKDKAKKELSKTTIEEEIENHKNEYAGAALSRVSQIISQITGAFGTFPLVTEPFFLETEKK